MKLDDGRLDRALDCFRRRGARVAVEFRHPTWFDDGTYAVLRRHGAALCLTDRHNRRGPVVRTADWTYAAPARGDRPPRPCYGTPRCARGRAPWPPSAWTRRGSSSTTTPGLRPGQRPHLRPDWRRRPGSSRPAFPTPRPGTPRTMTVHDPLGPQPDPVPAPMPGGPPEPVTPILPDPTPADPTDPGIPPPEPAPAWAPRLWHRAPRVQSNETRRYRLVGSPPPREAAHGGAVRYGRWLTLGVLCLSLVVVILGNTVLNVALPTLCATSAPAHQLQWIVDAYALVFAGLLLTAGALGDRFGRKGALHVGLVIFGAGSRRRRLRPTRAGQLIVARAVMGIGAALIMPATLSILTNVFPPHERAKAIAIWAGLAGAGARHRPDRQRLPARALLVGLGLPRQHADRRRRAGRRRAFLVPDVARTRRSRRSTRSARCCRSSGSATLLYGIIEAPTTAGPTPADARPASPSPSSSSARFVAWELRDARTRCSTCASSATRASARPAAAITLVFFAMFGMFFLLTQYLQLVLGYGAARGRAAACCRSPLTMMVVGARSARSSSGSAPSERGRTGLAIVARRPAAALARSTSTRRYVHRARRHR